MSMCYQFDVVKPNKSTFKFGSITKTLESMLRTKTLQFLRTKGVIYGPVSTASRHFSAADANKSCQNVDDLFAQNRRAIEPLIEDPIIVKNFFVAKVDHEQMMYPEVISKDELDRVNEINATVSEIIEKDVAFDGKGVSQGTLETFKQFGIFGYNVPKEFGGLEHTLTETTLASEAEAQNTSIALMLNAHRLVCEAINQYGSSEQRAKYLPRLARGELVATTAFQEWHKDDISANRMITEYDGDKRQWRLNGTKSFVLNAAQSNLFLVTAAVPQSSKSDSLSVFLVDGNVPGIKVHEKDDTIGYTDLYQASVSFKNVILPEDGIVSVPGSGRHIERTTQFLSRLQLSLVNLARMREISDFMLKAVDLIEQKNRISNPEGDHFEANDLRLQISKGTSDAYATESMLYMTVGLMDLYKNTNIDVESAIVKTFSQDALLSMALSLSNIIDTPATVDTHPVNHLIRDAVQLQTFGEPKDILKLYIGVAGIQHSGEFMNEEVEMRRNPLLYPEFIMRRLWAEENIEKPKLNLALLEHVTKEFDHQALWLEGSIERLQIGTKNLMSYHGRKLLNEHGEIQRLAEAATYTYGSMACLIRANRSWILGLPGAEQERILAACSGDTFNKQVRDLMTGTEAGPIVAVDRNYQLIAKQMLKTKSYFPMHPLTRFF